MRPAFPAKTIAAALSGQSISVRWSIFLGGHNIADGIINTTFGDLNPEQLVVADPGHVIVTGSNWAAESDINQFVPVGRGAYDPFPR